MKLYGSLNNRLEENRMFCETIEIGTGVTEYSWSDRHPYEVIAVKDQKHVTIRRMNHSPMPGSMAYSNDWLITSDEDAPTIDLVKRGAHWYSVIEITPDEAQAILDKHDIEELLWACNNGFDLNAIVASGKSKKRYHRRNLSFGKAEYHYDYEF